MSALSVFNFSTSVTATCLSRGSFVLQRLCCLRAILSSMLKVVGKASLPTLCCIFILWTGWAVCASVIRVFVETFSLISDYSPSPKSRGLGFIPGSINTKLCTHKCMHTHTYTHKQNRSLLPTYPTVYQMYLCTVATEGNVGLLVASTTSDTGSASCQREELLPLVCVTGISPLKLIFRFSFL